MGLEPTTPGTTTRCSANWATPTVAAPGGCGAVDDSPFAAAGAGRSRSTGAGAAARGACAGVAARGACAGVAARGGYPRPGDDLLGRSLCLLAGRSRHGHEDGTPVVLQLPDALPDVGQRTVRQALPWLGEVDPGVPAPAQLLDR